MYRNYLDHPTYGRLWYEVTLRNWNGMNNTEEENLDLGPLCEIQLSEYCATGAGDSPQSALESLVRILDCMAEHKEPLMVFKAIKRSWWDNIRWWFMNRKWSKDGTVNPVRWPRPTDDPLAKS